MDLEGELESGGGVRPLLQIAGASEDLERVVHQSDFQIVTLRTQYILFWTEKFDLTSKSTSKQPTESHSVTQLLTFLRLLCAFTE